MARACGLRIGEVTAYRSVDFSAFSLSNIPVPSLLATGASSACNEGYSTANSLLDVLVGGCRVTPFGLIAVVPTQPDGEDPGAPAAGGGGPYHLGVGADRAVTTCRDRNNALVPLETCLRDAAYSSLFNFAADRVILR